MPRKIIINGIPVALMNPMTIKEKGKIRIAIPQMKAGESTIKLIIPEGGYKVEIQSMFRYFSSTIMVHVMESCDNHVDFEDREKIWDRLFILDIVLWCIKGIFQLGYPWSTIYEIFTNGYFIVWLVYEWMIRKRYFRVDAYSKLVRKEENSKKE